MINFTVGPVQSDSETLKIGNQQVPYFRTSEFSAIMKQNEKLLCKFFGAPENSRTIFMTGSGTASMEAAVMNFFNDKDNVLVVNGGSFGHRFVELCKIHNVPSVEIKLEYGQSLSKEKLYEYSDKKITGMLLQLCETSTGVKYNLNMVGDFCRKNGIFLVVDAISGFLADELSMVDMHINAAITGSQKALGLPPALSFIVVDPTAQDRIFSNKVRSLYFNLADYLKNGERGQTPFTPAVQTLLQLHEKLSRIEMDGGVSVENMKIRNRAEYFRRSIADLPFDMFIPDSIASNCVTALVPKKTSVSAYRIFELLKDRYEIWVCPNGGELKDKFFRVGHIGNISNSDIDMLVASFRDLQNKGEL